MRKKVNIMKKIFCLLIIAFILSGCTAKYEVSIMGDSIKENMSVIEKNKIAFDIDRNGSSMRETFESMVLGDEFSEKNYTIKSISNDDQLGIEYKSKAISSLLQSSIVNQCYLYPMLEEENGIITFDTGSDFKCFSYYEGFEYLDVSIKTNHKVISSNADEVVSGVYTWHLTETGENRVFLQYEKKYKKDYALLYIVLVIGASLLFGISYLIYKKVKMKNKF